MKKFSRLASALRTRRFSSGVITAIIVMIAIVANMILYVLGTNYGWYFYSEEKIDTTITGATDRLFDGLSKGEKGKVKVSFCMAEDDLEEHDFGANVLDTARQLKERYPDFIELDFINIYTQKNSKGDTVNLKKYKLDENGKAVNAIVKTTVIFECGDRFRVVNDYATADGYSTFYTLDSSLNMTSYNGEEILASMIAAVTREESLKAYITTGHGETLSGSFTGMLSCAGYELELVNIRDAELNVNECDLLVISNPLTDFEKASEGSGLRTEIERLTDYVNNGGNVYITLDGYADTKKMSNFYEFLSGCGIEIMTSKTEKGQTLTSIVKDSLESVTPDGFTVIGGYADNEITKRIEKNAKLFGTGKVLMRESAALKCSGGAFPILTSSQSSELSAGGNTVSSEGSYCMAALANVRESNSDDKIGTVFVASSAFVTAEDVIITDGYSNKDFIYSVLEEVFGAHRMPYGCEGIFFDSNTLEGLTMGTAAVYTAIAVAIPVAIAAVGVVIIVRRKYR